MTNNTTRLHFMDNLRAVIAVLGIIFHATWLLSMTQGASRAFTTIMLFIHMFRLPIFFLLAGFFAHLLHRNLGTVKFIKHRLWRIGVPFISVLIITLLPGYLLFIFSAQPISENLLHTYLNNTQMVWFLYYLLLYYCIALLWINIKKYLPEKSKEKFKSSFFLSTPLLPFTLALLTATALYIDHTWFFMPNITFIPDVPQLLSYGSCFAVGWMLYQHQILFTHQDKYRWPYLLIAVGILFPTYYYLWLQQANNTALLANYLYACGGWLLVFASLGFASRHLKSQQPFFRYLSDASYWIYLVQLPLLAPLYLYVMTMPISFLTKFFCMVIGCFALSLLSYQLLVRRTLIGLLLNGKRFG